MVNAVWKEKSLTELHLNLMRKKRGAKTLFQNNRYKNQGAQNTRANTLFT